MILSCNDLSKYFGEDELFAGCSFHIEDHEKAAIVGDNGTGKTTLLKMLLGLESHDSGTVTFAKDKTIGYLAQYQEIALHNTIYDELLSTKQKVIDMENTLRSMEASMHTLSDTEELHTFMERYETLMHTFELSDGYTYKSEITGVLNGLGFSEAEYDKKIETLSGGQKTRVALGKILLQKPDIIFLDEPTNHLDLPSIKWLETYLRGYKGAVVLVSHDRYFLNRIVTKIIEIDHRKITTFLGNYTEYAQKKQVLRVSAMNAYLNQQKEIKHQEEVITKLKQFNREKSIKRAESREKMLSKIERIDKPDFSVQKMNLKLTPSVISGNDVLEVENLSKTFNSQTLFSGLSFEIKRGEHVAIIGKNGTGKTTILKIINEVYTPDTGSIKLGRNVEVGYYDQEHHVLHMEKSIFDEISDDYPHLTGTQIRNVLAAFLFTGDDVFKRIESLSGGERGRVSLAKLMLSNANFLILDEPTNHLDMTSKEILENALNQYEGTVLYVSHDRYFINQTAHRILELDHKEFHSYLGNYDYYEEKAAEAELKDSVEVAAGSPASALFPDSSETASTKTDWQEQKELAANKRKLENQLKKCEDEISDLEEKEAALSQQISLPENATNIGRLTELTKEQNVIKERLDALYESWEKTSEELSNFE